MEIKSTFATLGGGPERAEAVLSGLAAAELRMLEGVLRRWTEAGHPAGSAPALEDLEPDDTGNVFDEKNKKLIATPTEWAVYARVLRALE